MKKFKFELEQLLNLRQYEQDQAQTELGRAVQAEQQIQEGLDTLAKQYVIVKGRTKGSTDWTAISSAQQFYSLIRQQQEKLLSDMAESKLVTEEKRALFNKAVQKTESLKKLREREFQNYKAAVKKEEAKALDDVVTFKYN